MKMIAGRLHYARRRLHYARRAYRFRQLFYFRSSLIADANGDLFGTTSTGGASGYGTVFEIVKTATGYASTPTTLVSFNGADGGTPDGSLILDGNGDLFGTTSSGGANGDGTVFEIALTALGYATTPQTLLSFNSADGADPLGSLTPDAAGDLFGTTEQGGANGDGTAFEITGSGYVLPTSAHPVVTLAASPAAENGTTAVLGTAAPGGNGDALSVTLAKDSEFASGSTLVLNQGSVVYTPGLITAAEVGPDTLYYAVTDTVTGATTFETQTVTLSNGPPPVVTLATTPTASNTTSAILGAAAAGFDSDPLSVTLNSDADFAAGSKLALNNGNLVYTPGIVTAAMVGADTLKYTVTDTATGTSVTETQSVTLSNGPPPVLTLATAPAASNGVSAILGSAAAGFGDDIPLTVTLNSDSDFAVGSSLTLNNGSLIYTPGLVTAATVGADTLKYTVTDATTGTSVTETQSVTLSNGPPPVVTFVASPTATNAAPATLATAAPGYDDDPLNVTLVSDADFTNGSSLVLNNGFLTYTPGTIATNLVGTTDTLNYTVTDAVTGAVTTETQTVTLNNGPAPAVTLAASPSATNTTPVTLGTATSGSGNDPLKVTLISDADFTTGSSLVLNNDNLVYTPGTITAALSGTADTLKYIVTDTVTGATTAESQKVTLSDLATYSIEETYPPILGNSSTFTGTFQFNTYTKEITNISGTLYDSVYREDIPLNQTTLESTYYPTDEETLADIQTYTFNSPTSIDVFQDDFDLLIASNDPTEEPNTNYLYSEDLSVGVQVSVQGVSSYDISLLSAQPPNLRQPPSITGTVAGQTTTSEAPVTPFASVTIGDPNAGATDTLTISLSGAGGTLSGAGLSGSGGTYTLTGAAATVTSELDALSFTPTAGAPNTTSTTSFKLSDLSSAYATATVDTTTTVVDKDPGVAVTPSIAAPSSATVGVGQPGAIAGVSLSESPTTSGEAFTATLSDTNGVLAANTGATGGGGTITPSNGGTTLTIAGTLAQVDADLTTLTDTDATAGSDTINVSAVDSNGGTATPASIAVTVNGLPSITAPATATVQQNQAKAISGVSLAETGNTTTSGETFTATLSDTNGVLAANTGATGGGGAITSSNGGTTLTITGTLAQVDADLTTLTDNDPSTAADTITVNASDSFGNSAASQLDRGHRHLGERRAGDRGARFGDGRGRAGRGDQRGQRLRDHRRPRRDLHGDAGRHQRTAVGERQRRCRGSGTTSLTITGSLTQVNSDLATLTDKDGTTAVRHDHDQRQRQQWRQGDRRRRSR